MEVDWGEADSGKKNVRLLNRKVFKQDSKIFKEGDIAECAFLLKSGQVSISTFRDGKHVLLTTIKPNQIFGELALIDKSPRSATAIAIEPSEVVVVHPEDIDRQLENCDKFMKYWVGYLTDRIRELSKRVE